MIRAIAATVFLSLTGVHVASASFITLDFNSLQVGEAVLGYYDGGFGSLGSGPGPNDGITFTSDFVTEEGGIGASFQSEQLFGTSGVMDVVPPFSGLFSFYYFNTGADGSVNLFSGPDGSGSLLETIDLPPSVGFTATGVTRPEPFESAVFTGDGGALVFDNITFGLQVVPEPSSWWLLCTVLVAMYLGWRKKGIRQRLSARRQSVS